MLYKWTPCARAGNKHTQGEPSVFPLCVVATKTLQTQTHIHPLYNVPKQNGKIDFPSVCMAFERVYSTLDNSLTASQKIKTLGPRVEATSVTLAARRLITKEARWPHCRPMHAETTTTHVLVGVGGYARQKTHVRDTYTTPFTEYLRY